MKVIRRIFYTIFGILLVCTISLIGVMLYAEYTGQRFQPGPSEEITGGTDEESRLAYDDIGNIIELPGSPQSAASEPEPAPAGSSGIGSLPESQAEAASGTDVSGISDTAETSSGTDSSAVPAQDSAGMASAAETVPASDTEQLYIMDLNSGLFHTANCSDAAELPVDQRSERSTVRSKILDAGYEPCPHCNP